MFKLKTPLRLMICGASDCGKSQLLARMILEPTVFDQPFEKIFYCARDLNSFPKQLRGKDGITFHQGLPTEEIVENRDRHRILIVLDDLLKSAFSSDVVGELFSNGRHRDISTAIISQSIFPQYSNARLISLNANYIIVFKQIRDASSITHFAKQVYPKNVRQFRNMFINNVGRAYSYLICDFTQDCPDAFRFRQDIFSETPICLINDAELQHFKKHEESEKIPYFTQQF